MCVCVSVISSTDHICVWCGGSFSFNGLTQSFVDHFYEVPLITAIKQLNMKPMYGSVYSNQTEFIYGKVQVKLIPNGGGGGKKSREEKNVGN